MAWQNIPNNPSWRYDDAPLDHHDINKF
jgi:hypothetical protein